MYIAPVSKLVYSTLPDSLNEASSTTISVTVSSNPITLLLGNLSLRANVLISSTSTLASRDIFAPLILLIL